MDVLQVGLVAVALGFAFSMGAHYTGACMGMARASGAIRVAPALVLMAPLTLLGAAVASEGVEQTVGHGLLVATTVPVGLALAIVASAFLLTSAFNLVRLPTSTIQILVFSVVGAGLEQGLSVDWATIGQLLLLWAVAPFAAFALGFVAVRAADRWRPPRPRAATLVRPVVLGLVGMGAAASFAMGANDVSNASGAFVMTGLFSPFGAALVGGVGLAVGVLSWGRPLLERVAFDIVELDARMATGAQLAQATVILSYVVFGYFTSMNQALVGAMLGVGYARRKQGIRWKVVRGIVAGWGAGPLAGAAVGFAFAFGLALAGAC